MTLREAIRAHIQNELEFSGSIFLVPIPLNKDEGILVRDAGQWATDPTKLRQYPRIQLFMRFRSSETCNDWGDTLYRAFNIGRPLQLTNDFRVGRCRCAGPPLPLGPDPTGLYRRTLDLEISMRYGAQI